MNDIWSRLKAAGRSHKCNIYVSLGDDYIHVGLGLKRSVSLVVEKFVEEDDLEELYLILSDVFDKGPRSVDYSVDHKLSTRKLHT